MVYIGFLHLWSPIVFGILSYFSNTIFIYIILRKTRSSFGAYKYMLMSFGIFDIMYSTVDMVVAMGSHSEGNTFCVFVSHGPFAHDIELGFKALCVRCMFFSLSYGVLEVHFIYRYIALCRPKWISIFSEPKWITVMALGVFGQGIVWFCSVYFCMWSDDEMRSYLEVPFRRDYNADVHKIPILGSTYWGASTKLIVPDMSKNTKKMHRNLLKALAIQTFIPFAISYVPCVVAWSVPIIHVDTKSLNNFTAVIAVAAFPFIDPLAIMLFLPDYRNSLFRIFLPCYFNPTRTYPETTAGEVSGRTTNT
ncbi:hypothetical protein GCK72_018205 [Caenorhabditis remanei]|uniref:G-protein coupled receptors family 1 profile domain-containing protein n=1 Tax=Caenorhabditis remanei TaxID=31234 RepID=A0A6A5GA57_CAERE|nr:hypothetical protein GCK72_018205 [Caenorhabditis remanei]KAF1751651.1 hypothetical protein GCK72_018205 [Caenorhabditis remanei]